MGIDTRLNEIMAHGTFNESSDFEEFMPTVKEIEPVEYLPVPSKDVALPVSDYDDDYIYSRTIMRNVLERSKTVLEGAILAALNSENPKQYDAVVNIIKAMNDTSKNLVGLHSKTTKNNTIVEGGGSVNINNTYNYAQELKDAEKLVDGLDDIIDGEIS